MRYDLIEKKEFAFRFIAKCEINHVCMAISFDYQVKGSFLEAFKPAVSIELE